MVTNKSRPPKAAPVDDLGVAALGRRLAGNLRQRREALALSLDDLARLSGVSRAALSQIETRKSNPTVGVLWKVAVGLGVSIGDLIGSPRSDVVVLRGASSQVMRSLDGRFESRRLTSVRTAQLVELYELRVAAHSVHVSHAHSPGTRGVLVVLNGVCRVRLGAEAHELDSGDAAAFPADQLHSYENPANSGARYHSILVYER
jgi:transcriptional regulator with XRE-family HTH domain